MKPIIAGVVVGASLLLAGCASGEPARTHYHQHVVHGGEKG